MKAKAFFVALMLIKHFDANPNPKALMLIIHPAMFYAL